MFAIPRFLASWKSLKRYVDFLADVERTIDNAHEHNENFYLVPRKDLNRLKKHVNNMKLVVVGLK